MSCYPRSELPLTSISKPPSESSIIKSDIGSALPVVRPPTGSFPFLADGHSFAPKMQDIASALYGLPYGSPPFYHGLPPTNIDPAMLYGSMNRTDIKDLPNNWRNPPLMPFDPSLVSLLYSGGFSPLLADGVRGRKNATRETTSVLKVWLDKHRKNPYPTKSEKFILAVSAKMTLTQVSTWFANARRRLKKENKMTWSPRNCGGDEKDSGDENTEHGYHVSPSCLDMAIESQKLASGKSQPTSPQIIDETPPNGDMSHQQLHHLLQLLPPHLRTSEALKQVQEQIQWRSRWAAAAATNSEIRSANQPQPFVSPLKVSAAGENMKNHEQRRSSVGSPSTSSYDGSPSPFHRHSHPSWMSSSCSDQAAAISRATASVSPTATKHNDDNNESNRSRTKSTEYLKVKPAIWSPANMVVEKPVQNDNAPVNRPIGLSPETTMKAALENTLKMPLTSTSGSMDSASSSRLNLAESKVSSSETPSFPLHTSMAQVYLREYQRQLANHQQSLQNQHGLNPMMMPLAMDKNQSIVQRQILEQLQRNPQFLNPAQMMFSKNTDDKELRREVSKETENSNADAPINLSKSSRHQDESLSPNMKENNNSEFKSESGSASPI